MKSANENKIYYKTQKRTIIIDKQTQINNLTENNVRRTDRNKFKEITTKLYSDRRREQRLKTTKFKQRTKKSKLVNPFSTYEGTWKRKYIHRGQTHNPIFEFRRSSMKTTQLGGAIKIVRKRELNTLLL